MGNNRDISFVKKLKITLTRTKHRWRETVHAKWTEFSPAEAAGLADPGIEAFNEWETIKISKPREELQ